MKDKDLPNDYESSSLEKLTLEANKLIEDLESQKDLQNSIEKYQNLIKLNNIIEKKFKKKVKGIFFAFSKGTDQIAATIGTI